jgi:predicted AAA+ superfamily ATPase
MITKDLIKQVTEEQKNRVLDRDEGIKRDLLKLILKAMPLKEAIIISGIRRSGKSTLLVQILKELIKKKPRENILYVNFEDERLDGFTLGDFNLLWETFLEMNEPEDRIYLFLDEIQEVERWEKWINRLYEMENVKIFITGSNARLLSSEISTLLTGRNITYSLNTFSLKEICQPKSLYDTREIAGINRKLNRFFEYGSFPEVYLKRDKILLGHYLRDIVNRDIIFRHKIKDTRLFNEFVRYTISCYGRLITFGKLRNIFNLGSVNTAKKYIGYLEEAYIIHSIEKYSNSMSEIIRSPRKIFVADHALAEYFSFKSGRDMGRRLENIVFLELKRMQNLMPEMEIYYWKRKREVDFLVKEGPKIRDLIQVCWDMREEDTKEREVNGLLEAMKEFKLREGLVITGDYEGEEKIDGNKIKYTPLWKWLLT